MFKIGGRAKARTTKETRRKKTKEKEKGGGKLEEEERKSKSIEKLVTAKDTTIDLIHANYIQIIF